MDTFENENLEGAQLPAEETQPLQQPAAKPEKPERKPSPFADSPYVTGGEPVNNGSYAPQASQKSGKTGNKIAAVIAVIALVICCCAITATVVNVRWEVETEQIKNEFTQQIRQLQEQITKNAETAAKPNSSTGTGIPIATPEEGLTPGEVYAQNAAAVVLVRGEVVSSGFGGQQVTGTTTGSGFVLRADGYVVTNYHVVQGASALSVVTSEGKPYDAVLVGYDAANDVALLKVEAAELPAVRLGSSSDLIVGDQVVAIGNPLGELTSTMTVGYISAKDRSVNTDGTVINMLQTDAAINSGNSGGPLFNMYGQVIGITTAKYSGSTASGATIEGIGFAIPIDDVMGMLNDLMEYGYITGAYLGVVVRSMDETTADTYGLPRGSYVDSVEEGACAAVAGVLPKDIIVGIGEYEITDNSTLQRALRKFKAGDTTTIRVYRGGQYLEFSITFDEKPPTLSTPQPSQPQQGQMPSDGSYEEWYNYFAPFFGQGNG